MKENIWIAQRSGRTKDGVDKTDSSIIKMLLLNSDKKNKSLSECIAELNIVPVSVAYEWNSYDEEKAHRIATTNEKGFYEKSDREDFISMGQGIIGNKGHIHVHFGTPLKGEYSNIAAVGEAIDRQIVSNFHMHTSHFAAYQLLGHNLNDLPWSLPDSATLTAARETLIKRFAHLESSIRRELLLSYANFISNKLRYYNEG